ncbi:hypothetical protein GCM10011363_08090 [Marivita lacus]|uniref:Uncharacterized protein n=1 Tax=Marivita lacus TaxID=1323742 RepID=A0ABQ1KDX8_9RHOB|nr:hypothetical protein [Marivita lacus]GGB93843.1 hypothetical protein GCM10011363_08090 [Marivita lacus]
MILRPSKSPRLLSTAASVAAYEIRDAIRDMPLKELEQFVCPLSGFSIGVLTQVKFNDDGDFQSVSFEISAKPEEIHADEFHCYVSIIRGYWKIEHELGEAAEDFWFKREANLRASLFGRELVGMKTEELAAVSRYHNKLPPGFHAKDLNDALLIALASREREARKNDSNHEEISAWEKLEPTKKILADEAKDAIMWWESLTESDRKHLPAYDYRTITCEARAIFTYRDFMEQRREVLKQKNVELAFINSAFPLKTSYSSRAKVTA